MPWSMSFIGAPEQVIIVFCILWVELSFAMFCFSRFLVCETLWNRSSLCRLPGRVRELSRTGAISSGVAVAAEISAHDRLRRRIVYWSMCFGALACSRSVSRTFALLVT